IADSWPRRLDDSAARTEWGWRHEYDLPRMVGDMITRLAERLGTGATKQNWTTTADDPPTDHTMPLDRLNDVLARHVATLEEAGTAKGAETVVVEVIPPAGERGPRFRLEGAGDREFIRMNSNSYLGLSLVPAIMNAEE